MHTILSIISVLCLISIALSLSVIATPMQEYHTTKLFQALEVPIQRTPVCQSAIDKLYSGTSHQGATISQRNLEAYQNACLK